MSNSYLGNPLLKKAGTKINFEQWQVAEYIRCAQDFKYFCNTYIRIVHPDRGLIPFVLRDYQQEMADVITKNRFSIIKLSRQSR